jgi:hypothetical protein
MWNWSDLLLCQQTVLPAAHLPAQASAPMGASDHSRNNLFRDSAASNSHTTVKAGFCSYLTTGLAASRIVRIIDSESIRYYPIFELQLAEMDR